MFDIITIGSVTCDIFLRVQKQSLKNNNFCFALGQKQPLENVQIESGGGAGNTACGFSALGYRTAVVSAVGGDLFGELVKKDLKRFGCSTDFLQTNIKMPTAVSAVVSAKQGTDRTILVYKGACHFIEKADINFDKLKAKWFYIAPLREKAIKLFSPLVGFALKNDIKIASNPSMEQIKKMPLSALSKIDVLFVNNEEATALGGVEKITKHLKGVLVVSLGSCGAMAYERGKVFEIKANKKIKVIEKTGAGDAFSVGFLACFLKNNNVQYCLQGGVKNSQSVIQQIGAKNGLQGTEFLSARKELGSFQNPKL